MTECPIEAIKEENLNDDEEDDEGRVEDLSQTNRTRNEDLYNNRHSNFIHNIPLASKDDVIEDEPPIIQTAYDKHFCQHCSSSFFTAAELLSHEKHCPMVIVPHSNQIALPKEISKVKKIRKKTNDKEYGVKNNSSYPVINRQNIDSHQYTETYDTYFDESKYEESNDSIEHSINSSVSNDDSNSQEKSGKKTAVNKIEKTPAQCDICHKMLSSIPQMKRHKKSHLEEKPYRCEICLKSFTRNNYLKIHRRLHTGEKPYKCNECEESFIDKIRLTIHKRKHTGEKANPCSYCGFLFIRVADLRVHMRKHTGEKPFSCDECGDMFTQAYTLTVHKRKHSGEKPFPCQVCGKLFVTSHHLTLHMRSHTNERPYACDICDKTFQRPFGLQTHRRLHTGEKPFACKLCNKTFVSGSNLHSHMVTHSGGRNYACDKCDKVYPRLCGLNRHMITHGLKKEEPIRITIKTEPKDPMEEEPSVSFVSDMISSSYEMITPDVNESDKMAEIDDNIIKEEPMSPPSIDVVDYNPPSVDVEAPVPIVHKKKRKQNTPLPSRINYLS